MGGTADCKVIADEKNHHYQLTRMGWQGLCVQACQEQAIKLAKFLEINDEKSSRNTV